MNVKRGLNKALLGQKLGTRHRHTTSPVEIPADGSRYVKITLVRWWVDTDCLHPSAEL